MDYICQYCNVNLDAGDVFEHFLAKYNNKTKAMVTAAKYGWTETNKIHFNKSIIVQPAESSQYTICPNCKKKDPFIK